MPVYRVVSIDEHGKIVHEDFKSVTNLVSRYKQVGVEEDSYTISLHGEPIFEGLVGPMSEERDKNVVRYETPKAFAVLTEQWSRQRKARRRRTTGSE